MAKSRKNLRFGMIAVQKGYASPEQVVDALALQAREFFSTGKHRLIGKILLEQGALDRQQLDEILETC